MTFVTNWHERYWQKLSHQSAPPPSRICTINWTYTWRTRYTCLQGALGMPPFAPPYLGEFISTLKIGPYAFEYDKISRASMLECLFQNIVLWMQSQKANLKSNVWNIAQPQWPNYILNSKNVIRFKTKFPAWRARETLESSKMHFWPPFCWYVETMMM